MNSITVNVASELLSHEGLVREVYKDSAGVWTWSVGITNASGHKVYPRYLNSPQPIEYCLEVFVWVLERKYARTVREVFADYTLSESEFAAALSFHYNTGQIRTASWVRAWKADNNELAERQWKLWNKAGGKVSAGLVKRRAAECNLFFRGKWSSDGKITEYTRLKSDYTPDWGSAVRYDVRPALARILDVPDNPTPSEPIGPAKPTSGPCAAFFAHWRARLRGEA